jgi:hypothetical protein
MPGAAQLRTTIRLPRLGGTRDAADALLNRELGAAESIRDDVVILLGRDLLSSSESFADQLVKRLLQEESAREVVLIAPPKKFEEHFRESAGRRGLIDRVRRESAASLGV